MSHQVTATESSQAAMPSSAYRQPCRVLETGSVMKEASQPFVSCGRNDEHEACTMFSLRVTIRVCGVDKHPAIEILGYCAADIQAETSALYEIVQLDETLEYMFRVLFWYTFARIADGISYGWFAVNHVLADGDVYPSF